MKSITSDYQDPLKSGELILCQAYSGDVFTIQADNAKVEYAIPTSGAFSWVDSMAIPKGAPHPGNALKFMNYILEPKVGAALTNVVSYGSPNKAAEPFISKDILDNPLIYPPANVLAKLPFQKDIGEDELRSTPDRWTRSGRQDRAKPGPSPHRRSRARRRARSAGKKPDWLEGNLVVAPDHGLVRLPVS